MNKFLSLGICLMGLLLIMTACGAKNNEKSVDSNEYNNDVYTKSIYNSLVEIYYWDGDEEIVINNENDMNNIYSNFSSLVLTKASDEDSIKYGHQMIDFVTDDKTIEIGLLSGELCVDNQRYYVDKDIVDSIRIIALKNTLR